MKNKKLLGNSLLLFTAMIWGTAFVFQRVGMESIEPVTFNAARMALAAVFVGSVSFLLWKKEKKSASPARTAEEQRRYSRNTVIGGVCCGCFLSAASILQQMGLVYTTAGKAGFITAMYILLVPITGSLLFRKRNTWLVWLAVLFGVADMYFLCITEEFRLSHGDTLICLCALFFTFHILCCDHFAPRGDPIRISAIQFATATVISAVAAAVFETPTPEKIASALVPILYCGLVSGGIGYTLQIVAQKYTDPTIASLLLGEQMTARELTGCLIMFVAIVLVQIPLPKRDR